MRVAVTKRGLVPSVLLDELGPVAASAQAEIRWEHYFLAGEGLWRQDRSGYRVVTGRLLSISIKTGRGNMGVVTLGNGSGVATPPLKSGVVVTHGDGWGLMDGLVVHR